MSPDRLILDGREYPVYEAELHLPANEDGERELWLSLAGGSAKDDGLAVEGLRLPWRELDDLHGRRLHIEGCRRCDDDSFGTYDQDIIDNGGHGIGDEVFFMDSLLVDFVREHDKAFRCHVECRISRLDAADKEVAEEHDVVADFHVTVDERHPIKDI